jgi:DNA-binding response OmpR family regulator
VSKQGRVLIICISENESYWKELLTEIESEIGLTRIVREREIQRKQANGSYDLIVIDVTAIQNMARLVSTLRERNPRGRIVIATASPTWQEARHAFYIGATDYIRKLPNSQEMVRVLHGELTKPLPQIPGGVH